MTPSPTQSAADPTRVSGFAPYQPRPIQFLGLHCQSGLALKVYGISATLEMPATSTIAEATRLAVDYLTTSREPFVAAGIDWWGLPTYGTGTLIIHSGRDATFVILNSWVGENMLRQHIWASRLDLPHRFESMAPGNMSLCVWELAVVWHEREAWLRHVLNHPKQRPDLAAYHQDVLNTTI